jgi:lipopolysaccharide transport system ATP-binding protein
LSSAVIDVERLGKRYRIGASREGIDTLRDQLAFKAQRLSGSLRRDRADDNRAADETIWALRDVSFEVGAGEVLGVIGRNGAGKSTLLKILSRITDPTEGRVSLRGHVGSLLEVGAGFHPELTGRENVFLNGAILGMRKVDIRRKFDDIVEFADIPGFVDTPVKRYSSGMYVRLAFAVAAFLEPDVLLVDEVLAVGDARFQRKCLGKMDEVAKQGRTVVLVSHNMGAINRLCHRAVWLDGGRVERTGDTNSVVSAYLTAADPIDAGTAMVFELDPAKDAQVRSVRMLDENGVQTQTFDCDHPITVELGLEMRRAVTPLYGCFEVWAADGTQVMISYSYDGEANPLEALEAGTHQIRVVIPARTLAAGSYRLHFSMVQGSGLTPGTPVESLTLAPFEIEDLLTLKGGRRAGYFSTLLDWSLDRTLDLDTASSRSVR